ncbi:MAG: succinyl-diaminopimelate desuccinylase [Actinomycetota bacterium]|nr:succinyl-diaminopimelate desuccinylase [Actinomycetota bacterium]
MGADSAPAARLAATTLALVDIASESRNEAAAAAYVEERVRSRSAPIVHREEETLLCVTERRPDRPLVLLAGHLDTVPPQGNIPGRIADGAVHGLGASDMKGGLAVMLELARWLDEDDPALAVDLGLLFFPREELPVEESALPALFAACPVVLEAELAVLLEPTDNTIQAGCLGNLSAQVTFHGESAHSARAWLGINAVELAVEGLARVLPVEPVEITVAGLPFVEVVTATRIEGGIAANVVPAYAACLVNYRYAPGRSPGDAEAHIREVLARAGGEIAIVANSPPAPVATETPLVRRLQASGRLAVEPKQAWTPVAEFAAAGLDAVNFGPGATRFAHRRDERVEIRALERCFQTLRRFLTDSV